MNIPLDSNISISSEVLSQEVGNEIVLLDLLNESYFGLDNVGTRLWQLIQEQEENQNNATLQLLLDTLQAEYDVDEKQLSADLIELLSDLSAKKIIRITKP